MRLDCVPPCLLADTWPHITTFESPDELIPLAHALLANATRRHEISRGMKRFFQEENARAIRHARVALHRALKAATAQRGVVVKPGRGG